MRDDARGHTVLAVTNSYPTDLNPSSGAFVAAQVEGLREIGIDVEILHVRREAEGRAAYRRIPRQIEYRTANKSIDLIHVMYGGVMAASVARLTSLPLVVSFCGSDLLGLPLASSKTRFSAWFGVRASRRAARRADAIVVKSANLAAALPSQIDPSRVFLVPNGVDLKIFRELDRERCRADLGWRPDCRHALFYRSADRGKRPDLARRAVAQARAGGLQIELHEMAGVKHQDVPIWINASDVLLCTSISEGSPNTVKEALSCNVPVVSVDVGDVRERLASVDGCHVVASDAGALAAAISDVCRGPARIEGTVAMRDLSLEAVAHRLALVYDRTIERRAAASKASDLERSAPVL